MVEIKQLYNYVLRHIDFYGQFYIFRIKIYYLQYPKSNVRSVQCWVRIILWLEYHNTRVGACLLDMKINMTDCESWCKALWYVTTHQSNITSPSWVAFIAPQNCQWRSIWVRSWWVLISMRSNMNAPIRMIDIMINHYMWTIYKNVIINTNHQQICLIM